MVRHGTQTKGEQVHNSELTARIVRAIRQEVIDADGLVDYKKLAKKNGVRSMAIRNLVQNKTWSHIGGPDASGVYYDTSSEHKKKISKEAALTIRKQYQTRQSTVKELAEEYGVGTTVIYRVLNAKGVYSYLKTKVKRKSRSR